LRHRDVGADGMPHVAPVGFSSNGDLDVIEVRGHTLERTTKSRDVTRTDRAAIVVDDVLPPPQPRAPHHYPPGSVALSQTGRGLVPSVSLLPAALLEDRSALRVDVHVGSSSGGIVYAV
jgi:hypothetical protein